MSDIRGLGADPKVAGQPWPDASSSGPGEGSGNGAAAAQLIRDKHRLDPYEREWAAKGFPNRSAAHTGYTVYVPEEQRYLQMTVPGPYNPTPMDAMVKRSQDFGDDVRFTALEVADLIIARHKKYGPKNIANSPGGALSGIVVRLWDKLSRLAFGVTDHQDESVEDTLSDIAGYGIIGLLVQRGRWPE